MVDEFGAAASRCAIDNPIAVQLEQVSQVFGFRGPHPGVPLQYLSRTDSLSRVFDHFSMGGDRLIGENSEAMDGRPANPEFEAGVP